MGMGLGGIGKLGRLGRPAPSKGGGGGGGDVTAPLLSLPVATVTASDAATIGVTTNEASGTLYAVVTASATPPSKAQVKGGQNHLGASAVFAGSGAVSVTGAQTLAATGMTTDLVNYAHFMHEDAAGNQSDVATSAAITITQRTVAMFGSTAGFMFDPADLTTLFTTSVGGTPDVTADADPVGKTLDLSGNGFHREQASLSRRPLYKTSGGLNWLFYQGTDDYLANAAAQLPLTNFTHFCVTEEVTSVGNAGVLAIKPATGNDFDRTDALAIATGTGSPNQYQATGSLTYSFNLEQAGSKPTPIAVREAVKQGASASLYSNGSLVATDSSYTAFASLSAGGFLMGARVAGGAVSAPYFIGREYFQFFIGRTLTPAERLIVRTLSAARGGITL